MNDVDGSNQYDSFEDAVKAQNEDSGPEADKAAAVASMRETVATISASLDELDTLDPTELRQCGLVFCNIGAVADRLAQACVEAAVLAYIIS